MNHLNELDKIKAEVEKATVKKAKLEQKVETLKEEIIKLEAQLKENGISDFSTLEDACNVLSNKIEEEITECKNKLNI